MSSDVHHESGVTSLQDFPLGPRDVAWDHQAAEAAIRTATGAEDAPSAAYGKCFFWHDADAPENYGSYKLLYCDVIDGKIEAVPRAIFSVAGILDGARGGTTIPQADQDEIKKVVEKWYVRMAQQFDDDSIVAPWAG
jgi:hypothetical protein